MSKSKENNDKLTIYEKLKLTALLTPVFISVTLLAVSIIHCFITKEPISDGTNVSLGISILGVAVTVWIGLSIYNAIEKREVDEVKELYNELKEKNIEQKANQEYIEALTEWLCIYHSKMVSLRDFDYEIEDSVYIQNFLNNYYSCINSFELVKKVDIEKASRWFPLQFQLLNKHLEGYLELVIDIIGLDTNILKILMELETIVSEEIGIYNSADDNVIKRLWKQSLEEQLELVENTIYEYPEYSSSNTLIKEIFDKVQNEIHELN